MTDFTTNPDSAPPASTGMETPSEPLCTMCGEPLRVIDADRKWCENSQCSARNYAVFDVRLATPPVSEDIGGLIDAYHEKVRAHGALLIMHSRGAVLDASSDAVDAARTALDAAVASLRRDAERWRVIRPLLRVDGDYADGGEGWTPHVQFLICDEEKMAAIAEVGHTWTVEQLVDRAALTRPTPERTDR
jgi:hypothetical protein